MSSDPVETDHGLVLLFIAVLLVLSAAMVVPFLQYFLLSVLLAYVLTPAQHRLAPRVGDRIAAASLVVAATVTVIVPLGLIVRRTVATTTAFLEQIRAGEITLAGLEAQIRERTGVGVDLGGLLQTVVDFRPGTLDSLFGLFGLLTHAALGVGLTVFLLYYFLKDGPKLWQWLHRTVPLPDRVQRELYARTDAIVGGVLAGHVLVAIVQGAVAGLGLVVTGVPNAVFWTVIMVVLSLLPIVGSFLVWGPAVVYLIVTGNTVAGIALLVYGTVVVGVTDDYLRPIVMHWYTPVSPAAIIVGVLGGVYVLGFMGLFFGPIVIGTLRSVLELYTEEYGT